MSHLVDLANRVCAYINSPTLRLSSFSRNTGYHFFNSQHISPDIHISLSLSLSPQLLRGRKKW
ncbi:hypothetical protein AKJ16_DCAP15998 [Drosera capensis]